jgi:hypothetical protein
MTPSEKLLTGSKVLVRSRLETICGRHGADAAFVMQEATRARSDCSGGNGRPMA